MGNYEELEESILENTGSSKNGSYEQYDQNQDGLTYDEVYDKGWNAFNNNLSRSDCEYDPTIEEHGWWIDGFDDAEEQFFNNDYQY